MNGGRHAGRKPWPSALVVAVGLLLMAVLAACGAVPASTPTPGTDNDGLGEQDDSNLTSEAQSNLRAEERDKGIGATAPTLSDYQTYQWVGVVVEGSVEGPHLEIKTNCDAWVLSPANEEVEAKLRENIGNKLTVWGEVSTDPSIYMMQTIKVSSAYAEGDPMVKIYVPDYPCPGETDPAKPLPADSRSSYYYGGIDLQPGEVAVIGKLVQAGDAWYLETPNGKVLLSGNVRPVEEGGEAPPVARDLPMTMPEGCVVVEPDMPVSNDDSAGREDGAGTSGNVGCATPSGEPGVDDDWDDVGYIRPVYSCEPAGDDTLVVGTWSVKDGSLAIDVRYTTYWGEYICDYPMPTYPVEPAPAPDESMGVIYGHLDVGPLCPVEPCTDEARRDLFEGKVLVLRSGDDADSIRVELTPDGWFKQEIPVGTYVLTMPDCPWMGCSTAFPTDVRVVYGIHEEWTIKIDTGIR